MQKCLVIFSGGQDSSTLAGWAKNHFDEVCLLGFDYGQRHKIELQQAKIIAQKLCLPYHCIQIDFFSQFVESALLHTKENVNLPHSQNQNLPSSYVPNRNALFITLAHAFAQKISAQHLAIGVSEEDFSGYPDCRENFIRQIIQALNTGSENNIHIHIPFIHMDKAEEFKLAQDLGILDLIIDESHTCYNGNREIKHIWGYGCGVCNACILRKNAYEKFIKVYNTKK